MTTLATAAVEIVADTSNFEPELESGLRDAVGSAERASERVGQSLGTRIGQGMGRQLGRATNAMTTGLRQLGSSAQRALTPALNAIGRFRDGFGDAQAAASRFSGTMGTLGGATRRALDGAANGLGRFRDGFNNAQAAASRFSGVMGTLGGATRRAITPAANAIGRFRDGFNDAQAAASRFSGVMGTLGGATRRAITPAANAIGRFRDGFNNAQAAASRFSGVMGTLGGATRRAVEGAANSIGRFRDGFNNAQAAASRFSGVMGTLGGVAARVASAVSATPGVLATAFSAVQSQVAQVGSTLGNLGAQVGASLSTAFAGVQTRLAPVFSTLSSTASRAFSGIQTGFGNVRKWISETADSSNLLGSTWTRLGAIGAGIGAAVGFATLASEVTTVARSAQTTQASLEALYAASGQGAEEVSRTMAEMQERFRGLDLSVMNEGATALAYMGVTGDDAVGVLERLDAATTATGTGAEGLSRAFDAMTKGVNAGAFQMDTLNQISDAGIPIYDALADVLGVDIPQAQEMASSGAIGLEEVLAALEGDAGTWFPALIEGAENLGTTFDGAWSTIRNTVVNGIATQLIPTLDRLAPVMVGIANAVETMFDGFPALIETVTGQAADTGAFDTISSVFAGLGEVVAALAPFFSGFVSGMWEIAQVAMQALGALGGAGDALSRFAGFLSNNEGVIRVVGAALGGMVTALVAYRTAALLGNLASQLFAVGLRGIGTAIRGIPVIGWVLAAISALVALYQTSDKFREIVNNAFVVVRDAVLDVWNRIQPVWETMVEWLGDLWAAVSGWEGWQRAWDGIKDAVQGAWSVISGVWESLTGAWDNLTGESQDTSWWTDTWDTITEALSTAGDVIGTIFEQISSAWGVLSGLVSGDIGFGDVVDFIFESLERLSEIGSVIGGYLVEQLRKVPGMVVRGLSNLGSRVGTFLSDQLEALPERISSALSTLGERVGEWASEIPDRISEAFSGTGGILDWFQELPGRALEYLKDLGETIVDWFKDLPDRISALMDQGAGILEWLRDAGTRVLEFMQDYGPQILRGFGIALAVVAFGIPALLLGLLAAILVVLGAIANELLQWAWESFSAMMVRAGEAISAGISTAVAWFAGLPARVMEALANFGEQLAAWGRGVIGSMRNGLATGMAAVSTWWSGVWTGIRTAARNIFQGFIDWVTGAAGTLRDNVMGPINTLRERMVGAFKRAVDGIGKAWDNLRSTVAKPIEWVVNTAYDDWLRGVWSKVVEKFGGPALPSYSVKFSQGGVFPGYTPGRDVHAAPMAAFSGGESVLRPEITRAWGPKTTLMLNKLARVGGVKAVRKALAMLFSGQNPFSGRGVSAPAGSMGAMPRFASGGILGRVGGAAAGVAQWLGSAADDFSDAMMDFLDDPSGWLRKIFDSIMDYSKMPGAGTGWADLLTRIPKKMVSTLIKKAKDLLSFDADGMDLGGAMGGRLGAATTFARRQAGKPYVWGGVGPKGFDCSGFMSAIHNVLVGKRPYSRRYTTHSFNGTTANGFRRNMASFFRLGNTHASVGHMAGTLGKMNVESRGSVGVVVGSRARGANNSLFSSRWGLMGAGRKSNATMGGEGLLYDGGGWLMPGASLVLNKTRRPEAVRTEAQEANVARLVRLVAANTPTSPNRMPAAQQAELQRALGGVGVGGTVVNAPVTVNTVAADPEQVAYKTSARIARMAGL